MSDKIDHAALLRSYVNLVRARLKGDDLLGEFCGLADADRLAIRRIADEGQGNATGPAWEKTGSDAIGTRPHGGWFSETRFAELNPEAEAAWKS
jgi:hypothetical protein